MPPKPRVNRQMILDAAYAIAREQGIDLVNARTIAQRLGCSTQPVLYHFGTMEEIRREVYRMADDYHSTYLMQGTENLNPAISIGLNYIRFAAREKHLFRFLFQSDNFSGQSIPEMVESPELVPFLTVFQEEAELTTDQVKSVFKALLMLVHGWASLLANNTMEYQESEIIPTLNMAFLGMIGAIHGEETQK